MAKVGKLRLRLLDVYGNPIQEKVDIRLHHQVLSDSRIVKDAPGSKGLLISKLHARPQGLYRIQIDPPSYMPVGQFVDISSEGTTELDITFATDPDKIQRVDFPSYAELEQDLKDLLEASDTAFGFGDRSGEALYKSFDDIRKAGLLNIVAKARLTPLANEKTVLPEIKSLFKLRGDRFFAAPAPDQRTSDPKRRFGSRPSSWTNTR